MVDGCRGEQLLAAAAGWSRLTTVASEVWTLVQLKLNARPTFAKAQLPRLNYSR
jgi:hypothetical protein